MWEAKISGSDSPDKLWDVWGSAAPEKLLIKMSLGLVAQLLPCHDYVTARDSLKVLSLDEPRDGGGSRKRTDCHLTRGCIWGQPRADSKEFTVTTMF